MVKGSLCQLVQCLGLLIKGLHAIGKGMILVKGLLLVKGP